MIVDAVTFAQTKLWDIFIYFTSNGGDQRLIVDCDIVEDSRDTDTSAVSTHIGAARIGTPDLGMSDRKPSR